VSAEPGRGQHMPVTSFRRSLDLLREVGIFDIRLTGGEPTIHPNFSELVELAIRQRFRVGLISNGSGMRQDWWTDAFMSQLSRCWISLYGMTPQQHAITSVRLNGQREFFQTLEQVGIYSKLHDCIGISASLEPGASAHVRSFLQLALSYGVKRLRLLPIQLDGRALENFSDNADYRNEVCDLLASMRNWPEISEFVSISLNNMHDLSDSPIVGMNTCLLSDRRMPSITPKGDVYRCCYNVYSDDDLLANLDDFERCVELLRHPVIPGRCRAFDTQGQSGGCVSCPISKIDIGASESVRSVRDSLIKR
jgi:MoaA/NifB/PqqE/SkfB family radical SAM enzyme